MPTITTTTTTAVHEYDSAAGTPPQNITAPQEAQSRIHNAGFGTPLSEHLPRTNKHRSGAGDIRLNPNWADFFSKSQKSQLSKSEAKPADIDAANDAALKLGLALSKQDAGQPLTAEEHNTLMNHDRDGQLATVLSKLDAGHDVTPEEFKLVADHATKQASTGASSNNVNHSPVHTSTPGNMLTRILGAILRKLSGGQDLSQNEAKIFKDFVDRQPASASTGAPHNVNRSHTPAVAHKPMTESEIQAKIKELDHKDFWTADDNEFMGAHLQRNAGSAQNTSTSASTQRNVNQSHTPTATHKPMTESEIQAKIKELDHKDFWTADDNEFMGAHLQRNAGSAQNTSISASTQRNVNQSHTPAAAHKPMTESEKTKSALDKHYGGGKLTSEENDLVMKHLFKPTPHPRKTIDPETQAALDKLNTEDELTEREHELLDAHLFPDLAKQQSPEPETDTSTT